MELMAPTPMKAPRQARNALLNSDLEDWRTPCCIKLSWSERQAAVLASGLPYPGIMPSASRFVQARRAQG